MKPFQCKKSSDKTITMTQNYDIGEMKTRTVTKVPHTPTKRLVTEQVPCYRKKYIMLEIEME